MAWLGAIQQREEAHRILTCRGKTVLKILTVDLDGSPGSILYLGASRCPMTAWVWMSEEHGREVTVEPGFPAFPDPELIPDWALEPYFAR